ncbi:metallophosphoesterase [Micromonospora craterilacus]|uniref:Metallophosphoesterase n=1 Tax=Micromonospora craterilacus TaxID=1655439 RepID=A0A2W2EM76_9ACTN|nr:metallophosphoesterase [Micromonospora craterilacus]PZG23811.1 metallophosphoesterase [Micromonospora craterilacus]
MAKLVIIGDVGGCVDQLSQAVMPALEDPDAVVIQVGDLIDRGPDSAGVLAFVRHRLEDSRRWIQLIGNHESQYLGAEKFWPQRLSGEDAALLKNWWLRDRLRAAAAMRTGEGEEFLITHAGLTVDAWRKLGEPVTAATTADLLNTRPEDILWHERGPLWAEAGPDLYDSWLHSAEPPPFGQVHGHSTIVDFRRRAWRCGERIRQRAAVDWDARHTFTRISMSRFIGVDPQHGRDGAPQWSPMVFHDATLLV